MFCFAFRGRMFAIVFYGLVLEHYVTLISCTVLYTDTVYLFFQIVHTVVYSVHFLSVLYWTVY